MARCSTRSKRINSQVDLTTSSASLPCRIMLVGRATGRTPDDLCAHCRRRPLRLMLANELGRRGVSAILVDEKAGTAFNPQANATQARSMEHYRRLGFADEIRQAGLPADYPTDVAYFTRYTGYELARFQLPSSSRASELIKGLSGSWSAAELPHRVSQKYVEAILRRHAERLPEIQLHYGRRLVSYVEHQDGIVGEIEPLLTVGAFKSIADFLVGADGPRRCSAILGISYGGKTGTQRDFMGGRMLAVSAFTGLLRKRPACQGVDVQLLQPRPQGLHGLR